MNEIMEGAATPAQIAGFGVALRAKGETAAEMSGLAASMLGARDADQHRRPGHRPGWQRRRRRAHGQRVHDGDHRGRRRRGADGQARQPRGLVGMRRGGRAPGARRGDRPAGRGDRGAVRGDRRRVPVRGALPPVAAARGPGAQPAWRADRVQLPGPADQPGAAVLARGRRRGPDDGPGARRGVRGAGRHRAGVPRRRARRAQHHRAVRRSGSPPTAR